MESAVAVQVKGWQANRRGGTARRTGPRGQSTHALAIRRLLRDFRADPGLFGRFQGGLGWLANLTLLPPQRDIDIHVEQRISLGRRRLAPDLALTCRRTGRIVLLVEVWHSHSVSPAKRGAFNGAGVPWIEVLSWHVLHRRLGHPLTVLDWGGPGMPPPPTQDDLPIRPPSPPVTPAPAYWQPRLPHLPRSGRGRASVRALTSPWPLPLIGAASAP
jgi:hypothetical protein